MGGFCKGEKSQAVNIWAEEAKVNVFLYILSTFPRGPEEGFANSWARIPVQTHQFPWVWGSGVLVNSPHLLRASSALHIGQPPVPSAFCLQASVSLPVLPLNLGSKIWKGPSFENGSHSLTRGALAPWWFCVHWVKCSDLVDDKEHWMSPPRCCLNTGSILSVVLTQVMRAYLSHSGKPRIFLCLYPLLTCPQSHVPWTPCPPHLTHNSTFPLFPGLFSF